MATVTVLPTRVGGLLNSRFAQVVVGLLRGIGLGVFTPDFATGLKFFSDAFLKLITPIVFCVVVHGTSLQPSPPAVVGQERGETYLATSLLQVPLPAPGGVEARQSIALCRAVAGIRFRLHNARSPRRADADRLLAPAAIG